jgi:hypothetical protein
MPGVDTVFFSLPAPLWAHVDEAKKTTAPIITINFFIMLISGHLF